MSIRLLIADDHLVIRTGLARLLASGYLRLNEVALQRYAERLRRRPKRASVRKTTAARTSEEGSGTMVSDSP